MCPLLMPWNGQLFYICLNCPSISLKLWSDNLCQVALPVFFNLILESNQNAFYEQRDMSTIDLF